MLWLDKLVCIGWRWMVELATCINKLFLYSKNELGLYLKNRLVLAN